VIASTRWTGNAGVAVGCGSIVGMGESRRQRAGLIGQLANHDPYPNRCRSITWSMSRARRATIAFTARARSTRSSSSARSTVALVTIPKAMVWPSAGRREMTDEVQALCFLARANSSF
jgi:biotin synthase